jgi:hypothetical protein
MCSLADAKRLLWGTIAVLAVAAGGALAGIFAPWPYDVAATIAGAAASAVASFILLPALERAINAYARCRDAAEGPSACPLRTVSLTFGDAVSKLSLIGWVAAAGALVIPFFGKSVAVPILWSIVAGIAAAIGSLGTLLVQLDQYEACRNGPTTPFPEGTLQQDGTRDRPSRPRR